MSNIIINNKEYKNVPSVKFLKDGGGTATYTEGGGGGITVEQLNVSAAGTYTAPSGTAYSPVVVPSGTEGTPTAAKGTVSGNAVTVTPSVTNTGGYISGSTKTGTGVTVSASELVSGTKSITSSGTTDVTNYASASVASGSVSIPYTLINEPPTIAVSSAGLITSSISASRTVSPNVTAGYITSGTSGNVSVTGSSTKQLSTQAGTTITPTESIQTAVGANKFTTGDVKVGAISSTYVGSGITRRDSTDLTASGDTVSVPSGYYENSASKAVAAGSATTPYTEVEVSPDIFVNANGFISAQVQHTESLAPTVVAGYVSSGTAGSVVIEGTGSYQLPTQAARTITPSQNVQIAVADGKYTTGIVSVDPIPPEYIIPSGTINITSNGSVNVKQYAIAVVNVSSGITPAEFNDVNFYDYDGTIVYSYSASDFANLSALPSNPTHSGLTAMGWNWTLADAKAQVLISGELDIGQQYKSADGKTHLHIVIANDNTKKPRLYWSQSVANGVTIDWGDGTSTQTKGETGEVYLNHTYASIGSYDITLTVTSGTAKIGGTGSGRRTITGSTQSNVYSTALKSAVLGDNMGVNDYGLYYQYGVEDIAAFDGNTFSDGAAQNCRCIRHITYPKPSETRATYRAYQRGNYSLKTISLSKEVNAIAQNGFRENNVLRRVVIPNGVTEIGSYAFYYCTALTKLVIPATVTTIAAYAFGNASCMLEYHFKGTTPPTLADATVFTSIPSDCKIYVPSAALSTYQSANIWSDFSSKMVGE